MRKPDRKTTREILMHWRWWSRDEPPNSAEIMYYTVTPMFRDYVKPTPKTVRYHAKTAEMVEVVMQDMYKWKPTAREWLILYWLYIPNNQDLADVLSDSKARAALPLQFLKKRNGLGVNISKRTVERKMSDSLDTFAYYWGLRYMDFSYMI
jgi:hypothetical protein